MLQIVKRRYLYFGISLVVIIPGLIGLLAWGLPLSMDFTGGSLSEFTFNSGNAPTLQKIRSVYTELGYSDAEVRTSGTADIVVRSKHMDNSTNKLILDTLSDQTGSKITLLRFETVGPTIGREIAVRAVWAVALASVAIMIYIWFAFSGLENAHRFGISAIIAMLHDLAVVFGIQAILSHFYGWEVDSLFLTALLTVIGFSVHDTIVVFDRIRENFGKKARKQTFEQVVNISIVQTLSRSINTQLTVFLTLLSLALFGGTTIRHFIIILMVGILSGTYSSIFNASPILVVWENREWNTWFKRQKTA